LQNILYNLFIMKKNLLLTSLLFTFLFANTVKAQIPTNGLVAYYPFSGNAKDSSGNGNNGTVNGATLTTDRFGNANSAYSFNGNGNYIEIPNSQTLNPTSEISVSAWVYLNKYVDNQNFVSKAFTSQSLPYISYSLKMGGPENGLDPNNKAQFHLSINGVRTYIQSKDSIPILKWNLITGTYDGNLMKIYINGIFEGSISIQGNISNYPTNLSFGRWSIGVPNNPQYLNGKLDQVLIYNRALDSTEVQSLYHEGGYALPVSISNFEATKKQDIITVDWQTATEINTNKFIIQHSIDGNSFTEIGNVIAIGTGANSYEFTDYKPSNGINYYRLQIVDKDGSSSFSKVLFVTFGDKQSFSIVPNPAKEYATIRFNKTIEKASIAVYDISGKTVINQSLKGSATSYKLNTQALKCGIYVIKVNTNEGSLNGKLVIEK